MLRGLIETDVKSVFSVDAAAKATETMIHFTLIVLHLFYEGGFSQTKLVYTFYVTVIKYELVKMHVALLLLLLLIL